MTDASQIQESHWMPKSELNLLIYYLTQKGHQVLGPTVEQSAIVYSDVASIDDLPLGYNDEQEAAKYRITESDHPNYFEFNVGPHSWKQFLFPPEVTLSTAERREGNWEFETTENENSCDSKLAFIGVRACELAAIRIQDRVFLDGDYVDPIYKRRRDSLFIVAVNCTVAASTCFCTSMGTGPKCDNSGEEELGFDLSLTELEDGFYVEVGSEEGRVAIGNLATQTPSEANQLEAASMQQRAAEQISRQLDSTGIRDLLLNNLNHPHWDDVGERCLSCTNCTMVCPTCFCSTVKEVSDLDGEKVERQRQWDSCFNIDFGYTADGVVRNDRRSRYRQWLTHKLASWHDQFDSSGCVGCGRCITWCPVGIDLTQEVAAIRDTPATSRTLPVVQPEVSTVCVIKDRKT